MTQNNEREALKNIIDAWECLSEGSYTPSTIQMWLIANMKPAINSARKVIESISQNEHPKQIPDGCAIVNVEDLINLAVSYCEDGMHPDDLERDIRAMLNAAPTNMEVGE